MARVSRKSRHETKECPQNYQMGLYSRLSVEDDSTYESNSIQSQRDILRAYVQRHSDMVVYKEYIDDGASGTNFNRPGFQEMLRDIKSGVLNGVIVKDLSRFGRNFEETEEYLFKIFPYLKIRFISVFDDYDSLYVKPNAMLMAIKNLFNDYYAKDVSQKVGSAIERLRGEGKYWGPRPPYGYLIDPKDHHHLIIDAETADYVKAIFRKVEEGESYHEIIRWLHRKQVIPPMRRSYELGLLQNDRYQKLTTWYRSSIVNMLKNPAYYGALPVAKSKKSLWQDMPYQKIPQEDWNCVEDTHEPLISKEQYQVVSKIVHEKHVQAAEKKKKAEKKYKMPNLFPHKIYCGSCKRSMVRNYYRQWDKSRGYFFLCENYAQVPDKKTCPYTYIAEKKLQKIVLELLGKHIKLVCDTEELIRRYQQSFNPFLKENLYQDLERIQSRIREKERMKKELYWDMKRSFLSEEEYTSFREVYSNQLEQFVIEKETLEKEIEMYCGDSPRKNPLIIKATKVLKLDHLTEELVDTFVKRIEVFPGGKLKVELHTDEALKDLLALVQRFNEEAACVQ